MTAKNQIVKTSAEFNKVTVIGSKTGNMGNPTSIHTVLIADENGISLVFNELKSKLADHPTDFLTLIYTTNQDEKLPLFKAELTSLEKRLSHQLEIHYISIGSFTALDKTILQETLEVVINSNLSINMLFHVVGNGTLVEPTREHLSFLGIKQKQIKTQIIIN